MGHLDQIKEVNDIVTDSWRSAVELLGKGDSPGFAVHQFRNEARLQLLELLQVLVEWYDSTVESQGATPHFLPRWLWSLAACRTMQMLGGAIYAASETLDGFRWVAEAACLLQQMLCSGNPFSSEALRSVMTSMSTTVHVAPQHEALIMQGGAVPFPLMVFGGVTLLLELYVFMAQSWARWGDEVMALKSIRRAQSISDAVAVLLVRRSTEEQILHEAASRHAETEGLRRREQSEQQAALESKLQAKRNRKLQQNSSDAAGFCGPSTPEGAPAEIVSLPPILWMRWSEVVDGVKAVASGTVENQALLADLCSQVLSCHAQVLRSNNSLSDSAYYSHRCIASKVGSLDLTDAVAWVNAVLNLSEWYLMVMDLSHAEHCLLAAKAMLSKYKGGMGATGLHSGDDFHSIQTQLLYLTASWLTKQMWLFHRVACDANWDGQSAWRVLTPMFLNPLLPPEELSNAPENQQESLPNWSRHERIAIPIPGLPPPRKEVLVEGGTDASRTLLLELHSDHEAVVSECLATITIHNDCERYLELLRMKSDERLIAYEFCGAPSLLLERLQVLEMILGCGLNPNAFRNVLRQAEYDAGSTCCILSRDPHHADAEGMRLRALDYFTRFVGGFDEEIRNATALGKSTKDVLDTSDVPSYALGMMQCGFLQLSDVSRRAAATAMFERIRVFLESQPSALREYPALKETLAQSREVLALLTSGSPAAPSTLSLVARHSDPMTFANGSAGLRTAERKKATRIIGGVKPKV